ncbi:hypothetical protein [Acinetobacter sp.]|uniref:hypothetical protein n=1 Tax=Acinetobacter sp. TaxID=472 RepID=UPI001188BA7C|nr:hypothetical protein [Acinetobacter sp.]QDP47211.1 MAG: hypothetical protein GOVbin655_45 [Prokaryotic dsDNA virus sp.]
METKYTAVSNGWINKNEKVAENPKLPMYTGKIELDMAIKPGDELSIALWERNGSYSYKITKYEAE